MCESTSDESSVIFFWLLFITVWMGATTVTVAQLNKEIKLHFRVSQSDYKELDERLQKLKGKE